MPLSRQRFSVVAPRSSVELPRSAPRSGRVLGAQSSTALVSFAKNAMRGAEPVRAAVLDASVAVRWIVPEAGSQHAVELLSQPIVWVAPRLMVAEVAAALRRKVAGDDLRAEQAIQALDALLAAVEDGIVHLTEDEALIGAALTLALTSGHPVPDCLYLAIAEREGAALATADRRLDALARARGTSTMFIPSAE